MYNFVCVYNVILACYTVFVFSVSQRGIDYYFTFIDFSKFRPFKFKYKLVN